MKMTIERWTIVHSCNLPGPSGVPSGIPPMPKELADELNERQKSGNEKSVPSQGSLDFVQRVRDFADRNPDIVTRGCDYVFSICP